MLACPRPLWTDKSHRAAFRQALAPAAHDAPLIRPSGTFSRREKDLDDRSISCAEISLPPGEACLPVLAHSGQTRVIAPPSPPALAPAANDAPRIPPSADLALCGSHADVRLPP